MRNNQKQREFRQYSKNNKSAAVGAINSSVDIGAVRSAKEVIQRYIEIVRDREQRFVVGFAGAAFVAADGILIQVEFDGKPYLGNSTALAQFFQSKHYHHLLTRVYHSGIIKISQFGILHTKWRNFFKVGNKA